MINSYFRDWDINICIMKKIQEIRRQEWNKSIYSDLSGRETRMDSKLILEAEK